MQNSLNNIFGTAEQPEDSNPKSPAGSELPTEPYQPGIKDSTKLPISSIPMQIGIGSSIGEQRTHNEDALFAMSTIMVSNQLVVPFGLYIVADGMGGHEHGEVASELAVQAMVSSVLPELTPSALGLTPRISEGQLQELMSEGVQSAHKAIQKHASGGGSTLTSLLVLDKTVTIAHIGDSRAYHFERGNTAQVLTTDHSLVKRLEDLGQLTPDEAAIHPQRNVLYRALGQVEQVNPDVISISLPTDGYLVVCSDGLWGVVADQDISNIIQSIPNPQQASQLLIDAANAAGGPDNISVIIIRIAE